MAKKAATKKPKAPTKTQVLANLAEATGMSKKEITTVIEALGEEIDKALNDKNLGAFTIPGLLKITKKEVPARPAQKNVYNQLTKQHEDRPAKPATTKVAVRALKALKDMV